MAATLHLDFETRSACDLRKAGAHRYAEDPTTEVIVASYRFDDEAVGRWVPGTDTPPGLKGHIMAGRRVTVHNAAFERSIINRNLALRHDWPEISISQMDCTMARGAALALPQSLEMLAGVLGLPEQKDKEGHRLMMQMARPRKTYDDGRIEWWDDADRMRRLGAYCDQDVITEYAIDQRVPPLSATERRVWELDQAINDRGVRLDLPLICRTIEVVEIAKADLDRRMNDLTDGAVKKCSEVAKLVAWINAQGVHCTSVAKGEQEDLIYVSGALGVPLVAEAIDLRRQAAKSSTAKLKAMLACVCADGRARGQLNYHGATTGRWAGRLIQPQNLHRMDPETDGDRVTCFIKAMESPAFDAAGAYETADLIYGDVMETAAKAMRSNFIPADGHEFIGGDLSNIEGCVNAWLAGETWKIEAYRDYQAGRGPDLYAVAYARSFGGDPSSVKGKKRQVGKVQELALGYQGSVGAFVSMASGYGMKLEELAAIVLEATTPETWARTQRGYRHAERKYELAETEWTAVKVVVDSWRAAHPAIVQSWWSMQDAAIEAVSSPGSIVMPWGGRIRYMVAKGFLFCRLPSGRCLAYFHPYIRTTRVKRTDANGEEYETTKREVCYSGYESTKNRWTDSFQLYGGLQCENNVQAIARDVLVEGMFGAEARGYKIVLTVHDELLTETPLGGDYSPEDLQAIMASVPEWCEGLPLAAKTWRGMRYDK